MRSHVSKRIERPQALPAHRGLEAHRDSRRVPRYNTLMLILLKRTRLEISNCPGHSRAPRRPAALRDEQLRCGTSSCAPRGAGALRDEQLRSETSSCAPRRAAALPRRDHPETGGWASTSGSPRNEQPLSETSGWASASTSPRDEQLPFHVHITPRRAAALRDEQLRSDKSICASISASPHRHRLQPLTDVSDRIETLPSTETYQKLLPVCREARSLSRQDPACCTVPSAILYRRRNALPISHRLQSSNSQIKSSKDWIENINQKRATIIT
jgi:hypothetical protein